MLGKLDQAGIEDVISHQIIGRLGLHADNTTYVVPVSYAYDGVYLYGRSLPGMKINMLRKNSHVCFQIDKMQDMANWKSVIAWGEYEELTEAVDRNAALQKLIDRTLPLNSSETVHLSPQWPFPASDISSIDGIVFRIRIIKKTGRFENNAA